MGVHGFRRTRAGRVTARMDVEERTALRGLLGELVVLVEPFDDPAQDPLAALVGIDDTAVAPDDPALARLLPNGYAEDADATEFRRYTERSLREGKVANARSMLATLERSGGKLVLSDQEALAWLTGLNDLRLVLGTRLAIDEDPDAIEARLAELSRVVLRWDGGGGESADRAEAAMAELGAYQAYDWLTYLQETLVHAVQGRGAPDDD